MQAIYGGGTILANKKASTREAFLFVHGGERGGHSTYYLLDFQVILIYIVIIPTLVPTLNLNLGGF